MSLTLSLLCIRRAWFMLTLLGVGMVVGIVLLAAVPITTYVSITASLQHSLAQPYRNVMVVANPRMVSTDVTSATTLLDDTVGHVVSPYANPHASVSVRSQDMTLPADKGKLHFKAFPPSYLSKESTLIIGRFPQPDAAITEIVLTTATATALAVQSGDTLQFMNSSVDGTGATITTSNIVHIVGLITPIAGDVHDPFNTEPLDPVRSGTQPVYTALLSTDGLLHLLNKTSRQNVQVLWSYRLTANMITANNFITVVEQIRTFNRMAQRQFTDHSVSVATYGDALPTLNNYANRTAATQTPVLTLALQMFIIVIWFIVTVVGLLMDRQADMLATMRSRGASNRQLMSAVLLPAIAIAVIGGLAGPYSMVSALRGIGQYWGTTNTTAAIIGLLAMEPMTLLVTLSQYSWAVISVVLVTLFIALTQSLRSNIVTLRRETARQTQQGLWQRYYLDVMGASVIGVGYGLFITFVTSSNNPDLYVTLAPFAVYAPVLLLVGITMVFARIFPWLVRQSLPIARKWRGIVPLLLCVHLVQARQKLLQTIIFFTLATTFGSFALSYQASQAQHNQDYAAFQVGADLRGFLPIRTTNPPTYQQYSQAFQMIPGVKSATVGSIIDIIAADAPAIRMVAIDAATYEQTAIWPRQAGPPLPQLMQQLVSQRERASVQSVIPAIVDDALAQQLGITIGTPFVLNIGTDSSVPVHFTAIQHVPHIPMVVDLAGYAGSLVQGGLFVDFPTLATIIQQILPDQNVAPGYVWLKTANDAMSIQSVRDAVRQSPYQLADIRDRRLIVATAQVAPLGTAVATISTIGASVALLLAAIMALILFRNTLRRRLVNMTLLIALGAKQQWFNLLLILEDGIALVIGVGLGNALGILLAAVILPLIISAQASDVNQPLIALLVPPAVVIVPWKLLVAGSSAFIVYCYLSMLVLVWRQGGNRKQEILRLNED